MTEAAIPRSRPREKTPQKTAVHGTMPGTSNRGYCGRKSTNLAGDWRRVTCADCKAAHRADQERQVTWSP